MNRRSRTSPSRPRRHRVVWAACGALALLVVACGAPATRYRVLSFFFDGVPPPPGVEVEEARAPHEGERISDFRLALTQLREHAVAPVAPLVIRSTHQPVRENRCRECHDTTGNMEQIPRDATLCDRCHGDQRRNEGWNHGPLNLGTCIPCHRAHESPYEHLLAMPVPDLCLHCHVALAERKTTYHDVANYEQCLECHDPHRMY